MNDLPKPAHADEPVPSLGSTTLRVTPMQFEEMEMGNYFVKYAFREHRKDMIFQFFKRKEIGGTFPMSFRDTLWASFTQGFSLHKQEQHRVNIDWVDEADSWCVCVVLDGMVPPGSDTVVNTLMSVVSS